MDKHWITCRKCHKKGHYSNECPLAFMAKFGGPAPGYDDKGDRDNGGGAWNGTDLTPAGKLLWKNYLAKWAIAASPSSRHTPDVG
jgi:hypothetical protein